jgi:CBS domain containing-hemolysin-like protein
MDIGNVTNDIMREAAVDKEMMYCFDTLLRPEHQGESLSKAMYKAKTIARKGMVPIEAVEKAIRDEIEIWLNQNGRNINTIPDAVIARLTAPPKPTRQERIEAILIGNNLWNGQTKKVAAEIVAELDKEAHHE